MSPTAAMVTWAAVGFGAGVVSASAICVVRLRVEQPNRKAAVSKPIVVEIVAMRFILRANMVG